MQVAPQSPGLSGVEIQIGAAIGVGPTGLAAFDSALRQIGAADRNLVRLSSVIPPGSKILQVDELESRGLWGDRLYCVYAEQRTQRPGEEAWAGVAWVQDSSTGQGLFVEHEGASRVQVEADLDDTLEAMCLGRSFLPDISGRVVVGAVCESQPISALVVASFAAEPWRRG